jgi:hypothetical protein
MALLVDVTRDAGYGARLLLKNPGSSAIAIVTLALGIGVASAVFTGRSAFPAHPFCVRQRPIWPTCSTPFPCIP